MLVLPIIIIATRNAIRTVPKNIRDAALGLGASPFQIVLHHLLPLSIPGIMTGTILAVSRALGETAPLLMIGMVAFIADIPQKFSDPTTVLPVQIYLWSDSQELGFAEKTSAAILVLLFFLILLNLSAVLIRKKFQKKW
jgi:phosphate transport system permease protein